MCPASCAGTATGRRLDRLGRRGHVRVNDRAQLAEVGRRLNARIVRRWQLEGVTIVDPATTWIDDDATLAPDVTVLPNTQILRATTIAAGATIGPDTTLVDCEVGKDAVVRRTDATLAVIGAEATVGPFSYLRAGTVLGPKGKIGAYVETKNAEIGEGSKVPHLSYVGDATIGRGVNLGASTITANYDDVNKHRTEIGDEVHTGSHTVLVAPVRLGPGAKTGAGAVVRKDVPAGALAMSVAPSATSRGGSRRTEQGRARRMPRPGRIRRNRRSMARKKKTVDLDRDNGVAPALSPRRRSVWSSRVVDRIPS